MARHRLPNYLRTYRRRAGLSQRELAILLGAASGTKVSRYENFSRMPGLSTLWAYEIVFGQPMSELFAGTYAVIYRAVRARAKRLLKRLDAQPQGVPALRIVRKVALLRSIVESKVGVAGRLD